MLVFVRLYATDNASTSDNAAPEGLRFVAPDLTPALAATEPAIALRTLRCRSSLLKRGLLTMSNLLSNMRYALRQFRLAPIFTIAAILTLALGIGGTTAIFTLIHAIMLRSLPVSDPARLYRVGTGDNCCVQGGPQDEWGMFSYPLVERLIERPRNSKS